MLISLRKWVFNHRRQLIVLHWHSHDHFRRNVHFKLQRNRSFEANCSSNVLLFKPLNLCHCEIRWSSPLIAWSREKFVHFANKNGNSYRLSYQRASDRCDFRQFENLMSFILKPYLRNRPEFFHSLFGWIGVSETGIQLNN